MPDRAPTYCHGRWPADVHGRKGHCPACGRWVRTILDGERLRPHTATVSAATRAVVEASLRGSSASAGGAE